MVLRIRPRKKHATCTKPILGACSRKQRLHRNRSYFLIRPRRLPQARLHRSESRSTPIAINLPATRTGTKFTRMSVIKAGHVSYEHGGEGPHSVSVEHLLWKLTLLLLNSDERQGNGDNRGYGPIPGSFPVFISLPSQPRNDCTRVSFLHFTIR